MSRELRRAVVKHIKGQASVTALVPVANIHPSTIGANPAFPLVFWEAPTSIPVGWGCTAGEEVTFLIQVYARDRFEGNAKVETAESFCERIRDALKPALHGHALTLESGAIAKLRVRSIRTVRDGAEVSQWHSTLTVSARVWTG